MPDVGLFSATEPLSKKMKVVIKYSVEVEGLPVYQESYNVDTIAAELAKDEAEEKGADEAILLDQHGHVAEGSGCNLFLVRDGALVTAPITGDILEGITRRTMMQFARDEGIPIEERDIDRSELYIVDEAFFCGTGVQIAPIASIDGRPVGDGIPGPITMRLRETFFDTVRGRNADYAHYLTRVRAKVMSPAD